MLIKNNGTNPITMNLRDGSSYVLQPGVPTSVPDAATTMIDDSPVLIALFNAGTLTVTTDAGGAFSGFPTTVNALDSASGKLLTVRAKVSAGGGRTLVDETGQAVGGGGGTLYPQLTKFAAAYSAALRGERPCRIAILGDSTDAGQGVLEQKLSFASALARYIGASNNALAYSQLGSAADFPTFDDRVVIGAGWSNTGLWAANAGATGVYTIKTRSGIDRCRFIVVTRPGDGSIPITAGGLSAGSISCSAGANGVAVRPVSFTYASPADLVMGIPTGQVYVIGVEYWDSRNPGIIITNLSVASSKAADLLGPNEWDKFAVLNAACQFDLTIYDRWINDSVQNTVPATYQSQVATIRDAALATGDFLACGYMPINDVSATNGQGAALFAALQAVAAPTGLPVIDWRNALGATWTVANAAGYFVDNLHNTGTGQEKRARYLASQVRPVMSA